MSLRLTPAYLRMRYPLCLAISFVAAVAVRPVSAVSPKWDPVTPAELSEEKPQIEAEAAAEILTYRLEIDDTNSVAYIDGAYGQMPDGTPRETRDVTTSIRYKIYAPAKAVIGHHLFGWRGSGEGPRTIITRSWLVMTLPDGTSRVFDKHDMRGTWNVAEFGHANGILSLLGSDKLNVIQEQFLAVTGVVKGAVLDVWEYVPNIQKTDSMVNTVQRTDTPIRQFEYLSRYKPDSGIQHRYFVLNPCGGKMVHDEKAGTLRFTAQNLPSIHNEPFSAPDAYFSLTIIEAYEYLTRSLHPRSDHVKLPDSVPLSLGAWAFYSTARDYQDADKGFANKRVREKAAELTAGVQDPREKAKRIYDYVQGLYQRFAYRADLENWYTRYIEGTDELNDLDRIDSTVIQNEDFRYLFVRAQACSAGLECHSIFSPSRVHFPFTIGMVSESLLDNWNSGGEGRGRLGPLRPLCRHRPEVRVDLMGLRGPAGAGGDAAPAAFHCGTLRATRGLADGDQGRRDTGQGR